MKSTADSQRNHSSNGGEEENEEFLKTFKEISSTLPKRQGLNLFNRSLVKYQGFWYPELSILEATISAQRHFRPQPSDIFICGAQKTGTTWLKALAFAIVSRASIDDDTTNPLLSKLPHECLPSMEFAQKAASSFNRDPKNPLMSTHIPYSSLPKSILDSSSCKIVYICRDPKDTFVSMYHFFTKLAMSRNKEPVPLDKAFELFCNGETSFGPYWDHVLGYWKASLDFPERILFLKYEEMKEDTEFHARKLAEFVGYPFVMDEDQEGVVEKIVKMCSFEYLSNLEVNKNGKTAENTQWEMPNNIFFRKGEVHDWENYLTPEMAARLDLITERKLSGSGLNLIYGRE